jgi:hypothetical protein
VKKSYRAYGLNIVADSPIPGLGPFSHTTSPPDVTLQIGRPPDWVEEALRLPSELYHQRSAENETADPAFLVHALGAMEFFELVYGDGTQFVVDGAGTRVWGTWKPPLVVEDLVTYLLGPVMGFLLRRRGVTPLHASAVSIGDHAIAISGAALAGKSTTAAALALRGIRVLCEDVAPLKEDTHGFSVEPGYPRVCVWPDAVEKLLGQGQALPRLTPNWEKCFLALDGVSGNFETERRPLSIVYLLGERAGQSDAPRIEKMSPQAALLELVQNTYMNWLLDREQRAAEFDLLSRLVKRVPVRRVLPHQDPSRLREMCELILDDVRKLTEENGTAASHVRPVGQ